MDPRLSEARGDGLRVNPESLTDRRERVSLFIERCSFGQHRVIPLTVVGVAWNSCSFDVGEHRRAVDVEPSGQLADLHAGLVRGHQVGGLSGGEVPLTLTGRPCDFLFGSRVRNAVLLLLDGRFGSSRRPFRAQAESTATARNLVRLQYCKGFDRFAGVRKLSPCVHSLWK